MSYLAEAEKLRLSFEPFPPCDPPIGYMDVSHTQLSLARHSGHALVNGWHYTYFPASDELWRDDIVQIIDRGECGEVIRAAVVRQLSCPVHL